MGYQLHREVRRALGPEITAAQRLVALQIALDALDPNAPRKEGDTRKPRESRISIASLVEDTGVSNSRVVRTLLQQLADAGWELRVPMGVGKDGRILYAVKGRVLNFHVPPQRGPVKPRSRRKKATSVVSSGESGEQTTLVSAETTLVRSETTLVASKTTSVGPYVLDSAFHDFLPTRRAERSDPAAAPPATNEGRKDDSVEEDQNQRVALEIISGFGLALADASLPERGALMLKIAAKLAEGHTPTAVRAELNRGTMAGAASGAAILSARLKRLSAPSGATPSKPPAPQVSPPPMPPLDLDAADEARARGTAAARAALRAGAGAGKQAAGAQAAIKDIATAATSPARSTQATAPDAQRDAERTAHRARRAAAEAELRAHQAALNGNTPPSPAVLADVEGDSQ